MKPQVSLSHCGCTTHGVRITVHMAQLWASAQIDHPDKLIISIFSKIEDLLNAQPVIPYKGSLVGVAFLLHLSYLRPCPCKNCQDWPGRFPPPMQATPWQHQKTGMLNGKLAQFLETSYRQGWGEGQWVQLCELVAFCLFCLCSNLLWARVIWGEEAQI